MKKCFKSLDQKNGEVVVSTATEIKSELLQASALETGEQRLASAPPHLPVCPGAPEGGSACREDSAAERTVLQTVPLSAAHPLPTWHISLLFSFLPPSRVSVVRKEPIYHEWCLFNKTSLDNRRNKTHLRGRLASENRAESDAWIPILRPSWWVCSCSRLRAGFSTAVDRECATVSVFVLLDLFSLAWKGIFFFF